MMLLRKLHTLVFVAAHALLRMIRIQPDQCRRLFMTALENVESDDPEQSIPWLLDIHHRTEAAVDRQCIRWGNGVHRKHDLMTGIHSFFYERIPQGAAVLDVGCGSGTVAHAIAEHTDARVVGVDMEADRIAYAREHYQNPRLSFVCGDVTECFPDESFDTVVLSSLLEHLDDRVDFLRRLAALYGVKRFLIRVPTLERHFFVALRQHFGMFAMTDHTHRLEYSEALFRDEMRQAGLEIVTLEHRWGDLWAHCVPAGQEGSAA